MPKRLLAQWIREIQRHFAPGILTYHVARAGRGEAVASAWLNAPAGRILYSCDIVLSTYDTVRLAMNESLVLEGLLPRRPPPKRRKKKGDDEDDEEVDEDDDEDEDESSDDSEDEDEEDEEGGETKRMTVRRIVRLFADLPRDHPARMRGLFGIDYHYAYWDESVYLKNDATWNYAAARWITASARFLVTATPVPNARVREFNAFLRALGCTLLLPETGDENDLVDTSSPLRRSIVDQLVIKSAMPADMKRPVLEPETISVELTADELRVYELVQKHVWQAASNPLAALALLRAASLSPIFVLPKALRVRAMACDDRPVPSKIADMIDYVRYQMKADEKALIWSEWVGPLQELAFHFNKAGISNAILHGKTDEDAATNMLLAFQCENIMEPRILLLTDVGVHGLDGLQRANHILVYSPSWSPAKLKQLGGRINRPGQTRTMYFRQFLASGTYDAAVDHRNRTKARRHDVMLLGTERDEEDDDDVQGQKRVRDEVDDEVDEDERARKKARMASPEL